ncbi:MAG: dienelactone hydrolase family protein [Planctomycetaceae bacterium]|nr:dienelactone hydrolase family protein [Planctomycetaceae bacterium]
MAVRLFALLVVVVASDALAQDSITQRGETLPNSAPLQMEEPLDVVMVRGISHFADRELAKVREVRRPSWVDETPTTDAGQNERDEARKRLKRIIGYPEELEFLPVQMFTQLSNVYSVPESFRDSLTVMTNRWEVLPGVHGHALTARKRLPRAQQRERLQVVLVIPDADTLPEEMFGIGSEEPNPPPLAKRLADAGYHVVCPVLINRNHQFSGHPDIRWTNMPHREYVYRTLFEMGRHPVGLEVAKIIRVIDHYPNAEVSVIGIGEGGLLALLAGALDERVQATAVCGYFDQRENVWQEPIYRNLYGQLTEFGDAEIASLIAPRKLVIEASSPVTVPDPQQVQGKANIAAPGVIEPPTLASVQIEFERAKSYFEKSGSEDAIQLIEGEGKAVAGSDLLTALLSEELPDVPHLEGQWTQNVEPVALDQRMKSQVGELVRYSQRLLHSSDKVRAKLWSDIDMSSPDSAATSLEKYREMVHETFIGKLPRSTSSLNVRSRRVISEETHTGYEVVLDVHPSQEYGDFADPNFASIIAGGILLLPNDLKEGEQRPVVVCQHGLEGVPMDTITEDQEQRAWRAYKGFSTALVKQGYIVYAPQNPYRGYDNFRVIQRKSNPIGRSLFSYIIEQHRQTLKWLAELPWTDADRIAFYGLSYGGKTAVRVPPLLPPREGEPGYCLTICSADYNDWIRKNASAEDRYSYVYTPEYEIFEWNMGHIANYAELSYLMIPRPMMVERGHDDGVAPDEWVAWEYAKVRRFYDKLGIGNQTKIEVFDGPHTINGVGTYQFLDRHLRSEEK